MKKEIKKRWYALFLFLLIILLSSGCKKSEDPKKTNPGYKEEVKVSLWAYPDATEEEKEEDLEVLKDRLDFIFGHDYDLSEEEDHLLLTYKREAQGNMQSYYFLEYFIVEPEIFNVMANTDSYVSETLAYLDTAKDCSIEKLDQAPDFLSEESSDESPRYLKLSFEKAVSDTLLPYRNDSENLYLSKTNIYSKYTTNNISGEGYQLIPDPKENNIYYLELGREDFQNEKCIDLFIKNLLGKKLHYPFNYLVINNKTSWQDIDTASLVGINQVDEEALANDYYVADYSLYNRLTDGEYEALESIIKSRLDALDCKYAFGNIANKYFSIKIQAKHLNSQLLNMLVSNGYFQLFYQGKRISLSSKEGNNIIDFNKDTGMLNIMIESLQTIEELISEPGGSLYLAMANQIIAKTDITKDTNLSDLTFTDFCFSNNPKENVWFFDYLEAILNNSLSESINLDYFYYEDLPHYNDIDNFGFESVDDGSFEKIKNITQSVSPAATIKRRLIYLPSIKVYFHHPVDDKLITDTIPMIQKILEDGDFKGSFYEDITFYFYDCEKDERCWLNFSKNSSYSKVLGNIYFYNGRSKAYVPELTDSLKKSTFFNDYVEKKSDYSNWIFE